MPEEPPVAAGSVLHDLAQWLEQAVRCSVQWRLSGKDSHRLEWI